MDRAPQGSVEVGFSAEDRCKTVDGVIAIVHKHLDVIQDTRREVLGIVDGKEQRLSFFVVQIPYLLLNRLKHIRLAALGGYAQDETELLIEFGDTDSRQAYVFHVVKVRVEILCKATEGIRLPHAGAGGEQTDAAGILEVIKAGSHLPEVF